MENNPRLYNLGFRHHNQAFVLDATDNNLRMSLRVDGEANQKFVILEGDTETTTCPTPQATDIEAQGIIRGGRRTCRRRFVWAHGRCQKVFG